ncbi:CocE/NonD family hydrolase [Aquisalimonas sp.]|uniref:CocE/NonD family hydrolase n=1 Tax=unclassified Aquisalimonas TaxID=2644645 RepID=UPI0025C472BD|nr:CocE/NonD family hydrolase [Aquisalimonas sp.]
MKTVHVLPCELIDEPNVWIPMPDGIRLAARIWRPRDEQPVPAILEYIPYRKRFGTTARDAVTHPYLAGHGYACVRVDLRGSGESEGVLEDEYLQQELDDGCAVLRWLAQQPWCTGDVGMMGISWGGFNGLQIAALQPPELRAVVAVCASDDRFADDVHHMGGCLLGDNISWASVMFAYNSLPPDPELVGERWRDMWFERLQGSGLWIEKWLRHQRRDEYWQHASVREDYGRIRCPVYAVSGWADGYSNAVFRLMRNLPGPRKGLIGPWSHKYPHLGVPGPAIGFLQELLRWWDYWLKGRDTGIMDEPMLRVWMQESVPPTTYYRQRPGRWVAEPEWPSDHVQECVYTLGPSQLLLPGDDGEEAFERTVESPLSLGLFAGKWCSYAAGPDLAHDQREEDGGAMVFESGVLDEGFELMGEPCVELELAANRPVAMVAARLSDVAPDDKATRVTYGLLNLTHRESSESPEPLEPGRRYRVQVKLNGIAQAFPAGHRLRLSLSTSYWPLAWPPPGPVRLRVFGEGSRVVLPIRPPRASDADLRDFEAPEGTPAPSASRLDAAHHNWLVHRDLATDQSTLEVINDAGSQRLEAIDLVTGSRTVETYSSQGDDFQSARAEVVAERRLQRGEWEIRTTMRTVVTSTEDAFVVHANLDAYERFPHGSIRVFSRDWDETIPRDLV